MDKKSQTKKGGPQGTAASAAPPTVSGRWLLGAFGAVIAAAAVLVYFTLGVLFYAGQWQLVLHPTYTITTTPQAKFEEIHFDYTETGVARLDGWWIPADHPTDEDLSVGAPVGSRWAGDSVLYLHGADGSLSNYVADLDALHALGINVFAFDYRGYGKSKGPHPTEKRMNADADAAWRYLTDTRHMNPEHIVIYGTGYGASVAADLGARHAPAGVVLDGPNEPARNVISTDGRAKMLPMWLLLHEHFDPTATLKKLEVPKLFLDRDGAKA
ncbi:MAG TPA: alpha/beta hydrolase, partial [Acidobacteriaceae bacterium]|nr:alpha/beta hydrolase [Acidobacteriaceae bacterium]